MGRRRIAQSACIYASCNWEMKIDATHVRHTCTAAVNAHQTAALKSTANYFDRYCIPCPPHLVSSAVLECLQQRKVCLPLLFVLVRLFGYIRVLQKRCQRLSLCKRVSRAVVLLHDINKLVWHVQLVA